MKRPPWLSLTHPIFRREVRQWRKHIHHLWFMFLLFPCACTACLWSSPLFSLVARERSDLTSGLFLTVWGWEVVLSLGLGVLTTARSITFIAQERESSNWPLLRLTLFEPVDILKAKIGAVFYWLRWPIAWLMFLRIVCVAFTTATASALTQVEVMLAGLFALLFCLELLVSVAFNCLVGLMASAFARTTAGANAAVYPLHLVIFLFIFLPLWYTFAGRVYLGNFRAALINSLGFFGVLMIIQAILGSVLFLIVTLQLERITD